MQQISTKIPKMLVFYSNRTLMWINVEIVIWLNKYLEYIASEMFRFV